MLPLFIPSLWFCITKLQKTKVFIDFTWFSICVWDMVLDCREFEIQSSCLRSLWPHVCTDHMIKYTFESRSYNVAICHITMGPESVQPLVRPSNDGPTKATNHKVSSNLIFHMKKYSKYFRQWNPWWFSRKRVRWWLFWARNSKSQGIWHKFFQQYHKICD